MKVEGKVALITGAASGMGKGFAGALLKAGAKVCVLFKFCLLVLFVKFDDVL